MPELTKLPGLGSIDEFVRAFEAAHESGVPDLSAFAPSADHPVYREAVLELVRVELEFGWQRGTPRSLDEYRQQFPSVFADSKALHEIAFEEYRQRRGQGESPDPDDYASRYGVDVSAWSRPKPVKRDGAAREEMPKTVVADLGGEMAQASLAYQQARQRGAKLDDSSLAGDAGVLFQALHRFDPEAAQRLAKATLEMPQAGSKFAGFELIEELGRGAFGRVFLARQAALGNRLVALKISADLKDESQALAQLQHTNIVPIHSVHRSGVFHAVCMPYLGATTLADVIRGLRSADSLPGSGKHLVSTVHDRRTQSPETLSSLGSGTHRVVTPATAEVPAAEGVPSAKPAATLTKYERLSYVDSVLWMVARLADGLGHAHERGIIHRDLKPANVLLTDDGQPMLLDFNLSEDAKLRGQVPAAKIGGTLPYMSPEQLEAFQVRGRTVDGRSDIYSLGLILFELLTGRAPFPMPSGSARSSIDELAAGRRGSLPPVSNLNPAATPAVESIVRKCLAATPDQRYQTARELQEDIERHLANLPLMYAPEPSLRERGRKWARRHPRLTSSTTVAAVATVLLLAVVSTSAFYWTRHRREVAQHTAAAKLSDLRVATGTQMALINLGDREALQRLSEVSRDSLAHYGVDDPAWAERPDVANLDAAGQATLRQTITEMLINWADAERKQGRLDEAWRLNERAEFCSATASSQALWEQRAELAALLKRDDAGSLRDRAQRLTPRTANDFFRRGRELANKHEFKRAISDLQEATRLDPQHFWAWHFLGNCHYELLQFPEALACYTACLGLSPDPSVVYFAHYHRALVHIRRGGADAAEADIDQAIAALPALSPVLRDPQQPRPYLLRAQAQAMKKDYAGAEQALTEALGFGQIQSQVLLERSRVRALKKDTDGARRDREDGLRWRPVDESGWNYRGLALLTSDPKAALADFDEALKINPTFHAAMQNKSAALDRLGRADESLAELYRLIELYPGFVRARIGRAVLLARKGERDKAHADVRESLARDRSATTLYQAANVFALTSKQRPADGDRVAPLLAAALWGGFGLEVVAGDSDMDPVRERADFRQAIETVRELQKRP